MVKFEASDKFSLIEILDYSPAEVSMPAKLSRQPGSILSSLGLPDHVLLDLVKENHDALLGGLSDREAVEKWLRTIGGDVTAPQRVSTNGQKHQKQKSALRFGNKADRKDNYLASQGNTMIIRMHRGLCGVLTPILCSLVNGSGWTKAGRPVVHGLEEAPDKPADRRG